MPFDPAGAVLGNRQLRRTDEAVKLLHPERYAAGAELQQVVLVHRQRTLAAPEQAHFHPRRDMRLGLTGHGRRPAPGDINLVRESEADGVSRASLGPGWLIESLDALDPTFLARWIEDDLVTGGDTAALHGAGDNAPGVTMLRKLVDTLYWHPERRCSERRAALESFESLEHSRPVVPSQTRR